MALETLTEETEFVLDQNYLVEHGADLRRLKKALEIDLKNKERVIPKPPTNAKFNSLYSDVLAYIGIQAILHGFSVCPTNEYDERKIRLCLGDRMVKGEKGYKFREF